MSSDRPPDSSAFDAIWQPDPPKPAAKPPAKPALDELDDDIPAALAPALEGSVPRQEDRPTMAPPVGPAEYVRQMMELAELDDPLSGGAATRRGGPDTPSIDSAWGESPEPPDALPPLAREGDLVRHEDEGVGPAPRPPTMEFPGPPRRVSAGRIAAVAAPGPEPLPPKRAPSLHDLAEFDTLEGLGPDLFDAPRAVPTPPAAPWRPSMPRRPAAAPHGEPRRPTPTGLRLRTHESFPPEDDADAAPNSFDERAREMQDLLDAGNHSSALVLAESVLASDPNHAAARRCADACRDELAEKYLTKLGGRDAIPRVTISAEEIRSLALDHRAGFLLSFVDGQMSIDEVLDVSSMPALDALRLMLELRMEGVIDVVLPARRTGRK
jgi:hypothetical protein